jgi:histone H4
MVGKGRAEGKAIKRESLKKPERTTTITRGGIRRLAKRGGVKRVAETIYHNIREFVDYFLGTVVRDASVYCEHAQRKTITAMDVVHALKKSGRTLYGYGA